MAPEEPSPLLGEVRGILVYTTTLVCAFVKAALEKSSLSQPLNCFSQRYFSQHRIPRQRFLQLSENKMLAKKTSPAQYICFNVIVILPPDHHCLSEQPKPYYWTRSCAEHGKMKSLVQGESSRQLAHV